MHHTGAWLNNCPTTHCQTGFDDTILVDGTNVREAVNAWYVRLHGMDSTHT
jgi:hypothetical protein